MRTLTTITLLLALCGCTLPAPPQTPASAWPPVPAVFPGQGGLAAAGPVPEPGWRAMFGDPALQRLIELALANNRDLRLASLNVEAVQAQYRVQRAAERPTIGLAATGSRERTNVDPGSSAATTAVSRQVGLNLGLSAFEIDLFGRVRALSDAALARYLASAQGRHAAQISLVGTVADAYFAQVLAQAQRRLAERTLADWSQSLALARLLKTSRQNSALDVAQAEGQVALAEADLQARQRAVDLAGQALQLLVGTALPTDLPAPLPLDGQPVLTRLPAGLPSELLLRRPDLQQAEQLLAAAQAEVGAARAAFFPQISLTAAYGVASPALGSLFDAGRQVWRFAPQITLPLFEGGRLRGELRLAEVRQSEAIAQYERAIQIAFREVADGLTGSATFGPQIEAQLRAVASAERRVALSGLRYRAGLDGQLEWLDAQRQHQAAQQALLDLRRSELGNAVALYKALGGGLQAGSAPEAAATAPGRAAP